MSSWTPREAYQAVEGFLNQVIAQKARSEGMTTTQAAREVLTPILEGRLVVAPDESGQLRLVTPDAVPEPAPTRPEAPPSPPEAGTGGAAARARSFWEGLEPGKRIAISLASLFLLLGMCIVVLGRRGGDRPPSLDRVPEVYLEELQDERVRQPASVPQQITYPLQDYTWLVLASDPDLYAEGVWCRGQDRYLNLACWLRGTVARMVFALPWSSWRQVLQDVREGDEFVFTYPQGNQTRWVVVGMGEVSLSQWTTLVDPGAGGVLLIAASDRYGRAPERRPYLVLDVRDGGPGDGLPVLAARSLTYIPDAAAEGLDIPGLGRLNLRMLPYLATQGSVQSPPTLTQVQLWLRITLEQPDVQVETLELYRGESVVSPTNTRQEGNVLQAVFYLPAPVDMSAETMFHLYLAYRRGLATDTVLVQARMPMPEVYETLDVEDIRVRYTARSLLLTVVYRLDERIPTLPLYTYIETDAQAGPIYPIRPRSPVLQGTGTTETIQLEFPYLPLEEDAVLFQFGDKRYRVFLPFTTEGTP